MVRYTKEGHVEVLIFHLEKAIFLLVSLKFAAMYTNILLIRNCLSGVASARNLRVIQPTDEAAQRTLPRYDFPTRLVNATPGVNRVMSYELTRIDNELKIKIANDSTIVYNRPKFFVGSNGSVWSSEFMRLRYQVPELFTMNYNDQVVGANLELMIMLSDRLRYFWLMTIKDDFMMITKEQNCPFRAYELRKIQSLKQVVNNCLESCDTDSTEKDKQSPASIDFQGMLDTLLTSVDMLELLFQSNDAIADIWESVKRFSSLCDQFWRQLCSHLPVFKCRVHEFTDAGPGVGVTNHDVQYRIAEVIIVTNIDYYIRHHLSNGDSSHNEVERMQSYVGDAICDGGPLSWEYKRQYEGLSDEQLGSMTYEELEHNEQERMKYNAFKVCDELSL